MCNGNLSVSTDFVLVKSGRCILGNVTLRKLGVLHIGPNVAPGAGCNTVPDDLAGALNMKYPKVFQGIGKLRDLKLQLHVNPNKRLQKLTLGCLFEP